MKAVIIDIQRDYIIVVNRKGQFIKVHNRYKDRQIGDEIDICEIDTRMIFRRIASIAAVLIITAILTGYGMAFYRPVTYVTVDVNPSVEISLNRFDRTVDVVGLNEEGERLVGDGKSFRALPAEEVVGILLDRAREQKFLTVESVVMITISNLKDEKKLDLERKLEYTVRKELEKVKGENGISVQQEGGNEVELYVQHASIKLHNEAKKLGISQGKLVLYEKLKERDSKLELENIKKMQVKDILEELKFSSGNEEKENEGKAGDTPKKPEKGLKEEKKLKENQAIDDGKNKIVKTNEEKINQKQEVKINKKENDAGYGKQQNKPDKEKVPRLKEKSKNSPERPK